MKTLLTVLLAAIISFLSTVSFATDRRVVLVKRFDKWFTTLSAAAGPDAPSPHEMVEVVREWAHIKTMVESLDVQRAAALNRRNALAAVPDSAPLPPAPAPVP